MTTMYKEISNSCSTFLIPFVDFDGAKEKMIQMMALMLFLNSLWNLLQPKRITQAVINCTGATMFWMSHNSRLYQKLSDNVLSLGTCITTLQESIAKQENQINQLKILSFDFSHTSEGLKITEQRYKENLATLEIITKKMDKGVKHTSISTQTICSKQCLQL